MEGTTNTEPGLVTQDPEQGARKRRMQDGDIEPAAFRLKLPVALGVKVRETVAELKSRGVTITAEEVMADHLERISDTYFESQLLKHTPERFYIETAIGMPEVRERLIRHAKKSLNQFAAKNGESGQKESSRRVKQPAPTGEVPAPSQGE